MKKQKNVAAQSEVPDYLNFDEYIKILAEKLEVESWTKVGRGRTYKLVVKINDKKLNLLVNVQ